MSDLFIFNFKSTFVSKDIEDRYKIFLQNYHKAYPDVISYINSLIKSITIPAISFSIVEQKKLYGQMVNYRGSVVPYNMFEKSVTVNLRLADHNISYYLLQECLYSAYLDPCKMYIDDFVVTTLDNQRRELFRTTYKELVVSDFGSYKLEYNKKDIDEKTVDIKFKYNYIDTEFLLKYQSNSGDNTLIENYTDIIGKNDNNYYD